MYSHNNGTFIEFLKSKPVLAGLALRLLVSPLFAHQFDFTAFVQAARAFYLEGTIMYFVKWPYPILSYLILIAFYLPVRILPWDIAVFFEKFTVAEKFLLKIPFNFCDLVTSYVLTLTAKENGMEKYATPLALAYWLNPLTIYVSSFYGTFDSIATMLAVLAFYHFTHKKYALSGVEVMLGAAVKFQTILLAPPLLIILWFKKERKKEVFMFLLASAVAYILLFAIPSMIYYSKETHIWFFQPSISSIWQSASIPRGRQLFDPNMTYRQLLMRTELAPYMLYYTTPIELGLSASLFILLTYLTLKEKRRFTSISSQIAYIVGTYMVFYVSYGRINQYYALWALPFLLLLLASGRLQRSLLLTYNTIPIVHSFWRDSIFYYINERYTPYGVGWASFAATGTIFTIICLAILQATVREQLLSYKLPSRINQFFGEIQPEKRSIIFYTTLTLTFLTITTMLNMNGIYWASIPFIQLYPIEWGTWFLRGIYLPRDRELVLLYLAVTYMVPLPLALTLPSKEAPQLKPVKKVKLLVPFLLATLAAIVALILNSTLTYVGLINPINHFYYEGLITGWQAIATLILQVYTKMPLGGFLTLIHGGIITSILIWVVTILTLLAITPADKNKERK